MALVLPYPDMDFVPLDILTAAELNQMVANTEFIANQFPITASNITNSTITLGKLDLSTFPVIADNWSSTTTGAFSRSINIASIPTGAKFFICSTGYLNLNASGSVSIRYSYNSTNTALTWVDNTTSNRGAFPIACSYMFTKASGVNTLTFASYSATGLNDKGFATTIFVV